MNYVWPMLLILSVLIGLWMGKEWSDIKYQRTIVDLRHELKLWRDIAKKRIET